MKIYIDSGLPRSGKKFLKMKNFPGQGKVRELHFQSGKFKKNEKSHGKVREFQNFLKKMLVNRLLEILVSIICKQYEKRNVSEHKLQAIYVQKHSFSNIYGLRFFFKD